MMPEYRAHELKQTHEIVLCKMIENMCVELLNRSIGLHPQEFSERDTRFCDGVIIHIAGHANMHEFCSLTETIPLSM